jgi:hypothetical protein
MTRPDWKNIPMPRRIENLPTEPERGYPVPFFVAYINGKADFRIADNEKRVRCIREHLCWICGEKLGKYLGFVIGPMCAVNRISAEPPMHRECAEYSVQVCPFLLNPNQKRNPKAVAAPIDEAPGIMIARNPGVMLLWMTNSFTLVQDQNNQVLFRIGPALQLSWYAEGRRATRAEVEESFNSGLPLLEEMARGDGPKAVEALAAQVEIARKLLPAA